MMAALRWVWGICIIILRSCSQMGWNMLGRSFVIISYMLFIKYYVLNYYQ